MNALPDLHDPRLRSLAPGGVFSATGEEIRGILGLLSGLPAASTTPEWRWYFDPKWGDAGPQERLRVFLILKATTPSFARLFKDAVAASRLAEFYSLSTTHAPEIPQHSLGWACDVVRRRTMLPASFECYENADVPPQCLTIGPFDSIDDNRFNELE